MGGGFPRDGLDLDGYRLRADFSRVFASEVTEDPKSPFPLGLSSSNQRVLHSTKRRNRILERNPLFFLEFKEPVCFIRKHL